MRSFGASRPTSWTRAGMTQHFSICCTLRLRARRRPARQNYRHAQAADRRRCPKAAEIAVAAIPPTPPALLPRACLRSPGRRCSPSGRSAAPARRLGSLARLNEATTGTAPPRSGVQLLLDEEGELALPRAREIQSEVAGPGCTGWPLTSGPWPRTVPPRRQSRSRSR